MTNVFAVSMRETVPSNELEMDGYNLSLDSSRQGGGVPCFSNLCKEIESIFV